MGKIVFKKILIEDLPEFFSAGEKMLSEKSLYGKGWCRERIADLFMDKTALMTAAVRDRKILGIAAGAVAENSSGIMDLTWIGVIGKFSGTGLLEDIFRSFADAAGNEGIESICIKSDQFPEDILSSFLNECGFIETGVVKIFKKQL